MDNNQQTGFTLIELLVALAVAAILLGVGIPSFSGAIKNSQVSSDYNGLVQALYLARSEAVKTNENVTVCPKKDIDSTVCGGATDLWKNGWLVFIDNRPASNDDFGSAEIGPEDEIISIHDEIRSDNKIIVTGSASLGTPKPRFYIQYENDGTANWANGTFALCNDKDDELSRAIVVAPTGDVRPGRPSGSQRPRNAQGLETC